MFGHRTLESRRRPRAAHLRPQLRHLRTPELSRVLVGPGRALQARGLDLRRLQDVPRLRKNANQGEESNFRSNLTPSYVSSQEDLIICEYCDEGVHYSCLDPRPEKRPKVWACDDCLIARGKQPNNNIKKRAEEHQNGYGEADEEGPPSLSSALAPVSTASPSSPPDLKQEPMEVDGDDSLSAKGEFGWHPSY